MKIAIVGSEEKHWKPEQKTEVVKQIKEILTSNIIVTGPAHYGETIYPVLISGGCPKGGVDIWAEVIADTLGIPKEIYHPDVHVWSVTGSNRKGYRERNIEIAENCDVLYCFDPWHREWSGGRWTMNHAEKLGKEVHFIVV